MQNNLWNAFLHTAHSRPEHPALVFIPVPHGPSTALTFTELRDLALRAAALLRDLGVRRGDVVALQLPKRPESYALLLACLRLGALYVAIDPKSPATRTAQILTRLAARILFSESPESITLGHPLQRVTLPSFTAHGPAYHSWPAPLAFHDPLDESSGSSPAYIMFTSGSTGEPKGAVIPQMGILQLMAWGRSLIGDPTKHRFSGLNPIHFDNSVFDFYCGLCNGATLVPVETAELNSPQQWVDVLTQAQTSVLFAVPTLFQLLDKSGLLTPGQLPFARHFLFGGEGFPIHLLRAFYDRFQGQAQLTNVYGPTETSCICSSIVLDRAALDAAGDGFASLGRMHDGFEYAVLDENNQSVSVNEPGELWIGGPGVGLGYFGDPAETERRFRQDPRQVQYRSIFYRSGDLVRFDEQNLLWFVGRADNQIKIGGHRIELEEVDHAIEAHADVRRAASTLIVSGDNRDIVAAFEATRPVDANELTAWCRTRIPGYMIPSQFQQFDALPLNQNGKVDRRACRDILLARPSPAATPTLAPAADRQSLILDIWARILQVSHVTPDSNFFDLGGTSLLLVQVHETLQKELGLSVTLNDLFVYPRIADLIRFLDGQSSTSAVIDAAKERAARARRAFRPQAESGGKEPHGRVQ